MKYNYNDHMKLPRLLLIPFFILSMIVLTGFFSCSRAEPEILYGFIDLVYYMGRDKTEERFSFFILPEDDDGVDNLSELYLYNDREGLRWLFTSDDWIRYEEDGKIWIGSRNIAMVGDASLPRGQYRAVLVNKGGESKERKFTYDGPENPPYPFPSFSVSDGLYRIDSLYPVNRIMCYDQQGRIAQIIQVRELSGNLRDLRLAGTARTMSLWAEEPEYRISVLTEAISVR
jgi:hypothetical protein